MSKQSISCSKCYHFRALDDKGYAYRPAACMHPDCFNQVLCQNRHGEVRTGKERELDIIDFNPDGKCSRFEPFVIKVSEGKGGPSTVERKTMNWTDSLRVIPDGVQTLSKMPSKHVDGVYPKYIQHAKGAYVWGDDGKKYIDYPCGLGAVLLGYADPQVNQAVIDQLAKGMIFSLPNQLETELAEKICDIIPSAEMVRFLKSGSEACSAAVRIARAYTGRANIITAGYHGWHDWYAWTTPKKRGVLSQPVRQAKYNDIDSFKVNDKTAAVIIEPYVLDEPKDDFLKNLRKKCTKHNTILIFDEVVTGFRTLGWSAQKYFDVTPDLTCLGKPMANGLPISCVCGKKEIMKVLESDCFVSSTFGGELLSIAAALAVIKIIEDESVIGHIWRMGAEFIEHFNRMAANLQVVDVPKCLGLPPRTFFKFPTEAHKSVFWQECLRRGVLFGYAQFMSYAHKRGELDDTVIAMGEAFRLLRKYWSHPEDALEGKVAQETFRLVTEKEKK